MKCECGSSLEKTTNCEQYKVGDMVLVIANIPMFECPSCHAFYYDNNVLDRIDEIVASIKENADQKITLFDFELACATA
ncbi:MAG: YgiT-type zinc finger protein [Dehalococcoidia bacterium]|nr:MAG: YgiT-type zinc finger protein [Dehalococcoidia bacterium]